MCVYDTLFEHTQATTSYEAHLCRVIELEPVCVTRIALDGRFLAVNIAAQSMLGAERLDQVLGTALIDLIPGDQHPLFRDLLARLAAGERRSGEFELTGLDQMRRAVLLHAVPLPEPHDGIASAVCTFHVITELRRLERTLTEIAARAEDEATGRAGLGARLDAIVGEERQTVSVAGTEAAAGEIAAAEKLAALEVEVGTARRELARREVAHAAELAALQARLAGDGAGGELRPEQATAAGIEKQALERRLRRSEGLARAGRLAISVMADLEQCFRSIADRAGALAGTAGDGEERDRALAEIVGAVFDGVGLVHEISTIAPPTCDDWHPRPTCPEE